MTIPAGPYADTRDMFMVHTMFRREFGLLPALVRGVPVGDRKRARIVADHAELMSTVLHAHHHSEDTHLWPKLLERGTEEIAPIVHVMERQHAGIEGINAEVTTAMPAWRDNPTTENNAVLADALERLVPVLDQHMGLEEQRILPIAEKCITEAEWGEMASGTGNEIPPNQLVLVYGMSLYEGDPEVIENTLSRMPPEVRSTLEELGPLEFASHSELVHGTSTPPRSGR